MRYLSISQIGSFTALAPGSGDYLALRPSQCSGGSDPPTRVTEQPAPGIDGALILRPLDDVWVITLGGDFVVTSTGLSSEGDYRDTVEAMYQSLLSAIEAAKTAPIDLVHSGGTLKVWKHAPVEPSWDDLETICSVVFGVTVDVFAT